MIRCVFLCAILVLLFLSGARLMINKIVGGYRCSIEDTPYLVSLSNDHWNKKAKKYKRHYYCGGSLLSALWILTAAHCFLDRDMSMPVYITAGQTCQTDVSSPGIQVSEIEEIFIHPRFSAQTKTADLALAKLKTPISESNHVKFVELGHQLDDSWLWRNCNDSLVSGWGSLYAMDDLEKPLEKVKVDKNACLRCLELAVIPTKKCVRVNQEFTGVPPDKLPFRGGLKSVVCARRDKKDTCEGDSGAPLICRGRQIGIVSLGVGCAYGPVAPIYTRVDFYYNFIQRVMLQAAESDIESSFDDFYI